MSIEISVLESEKLIVSRLSGRLTDMDLLDAQDYFENKVTWSDGTAELIDLTNADLAAATTRLMPELAERFEAFFDNAGVETARVALCSPNDLQFGMSRVFETWANRSSIATFATFRDWKSADLWLRSSESLPDSG
ncbi:MAG: hypothetical protein AAFS02_11225 [Pseudomonadota bacterium]